MDRELLSIRNAVTDSRTALSRQFQLLTQQVDRERFGVFLAVYCRQAAGLARLMVDWSQQLCQSVTEPGQEALLASLKAISAQLETRHTTLETDFLAVKTWAQKVLSYGFELPSQMKLSAGVKQLRFVFSGCIKSKYYVSWLLVVTELERLRIVHGFTLVKMCELFFGQDVLHCFSHIHYQHQNPNELFSLCDHALETHMRLHRASVPSMIADVRKAIEAYGCFIHDCFQMSLQRIPHELNTAGN